VSHFSEDQLNRYEMFRRAAFPKAAVKRVRRCIEMYLNELTILCTTFIHVNAKLESSF